MTHTHDIIVGVDFSEDSVAGLAQGIRAAQWHRARLHALHVVEHLPVVNHPNFGMLGFSDIEQESVRQAEARLGDLVEFVRAQVAAAGGGPAGDIEVHRHVVIGSPFVELMLMIKELAADLLVLGAHGEHSSRKRAGTLATRCVRKAPIQVMLVRKRHRGPFKNIVCCVDFSDACRGAVEQAMSLAAQDEAKLQVLHVVIPPWHYPELASMARLKSAEYQQAFRKVFAAELDAFLNGFKPDARALKVQPVIIENANPAAGIAQYLQENNADLAVVGTRGRTGHKWVLMGTTAERIIHVLPCSILAVKPPDFKYDLA